MNQWCPPPCPPPRPCPPPCPPASCVDQVEACYDMSQQLYALVKKVLADVIANEPGLLTPMGVTDGSDVQPGQVGEFIQLEQSFAIPTTWNFQALVSLGELPAGDWDCQVSVTAGGALVGGLNYYLDPMPAGFSNNMGTELGMYVSLAEAAMMQGGTNGTSARALTSTGSAIYFFVQLNYLGGNGVINPQAGTGYITFTARRRR